jgi:hypothetical protein
MGNCIVVSFFTVAETVEDKEEDRGDFHARFGRS